MRDDYSIPDRDRDVYLLNFSTNDFDVFTMESVGNTLCDTYKQSKSK